MRYTTISYSGLDLDTFLGESGKCYVTLTSAANGLGISRQNIKDWVNRHCKVKGLPVQVGKFKSAATAYHVSVLREFLEYRVSLGDQQATALVFTSFEADIERSIKEANGIQVTAALQEEVRTSKRLEYLQQWVADNYQPTMQKNGVVLKIDNSLVRDAGFENSTEELIVDLEAMIARREVYIASGKWGADQCAEERRGIERYREDIQTLAQSLSN